MRRKKPTTLPLGTISEGTLGPEDLIPAYLDVLDGIRLTKQERIDVRQIRARFNFRERYEHEHESEEVDSLYHILNSHCPDYAYFGSLEGDGACFGVWPSIDLVNEEVDRVAELPPIDRRRSPIHIAQVSDHGNVTLYRRSGNRWIEVWSVA